MSTRRDRARALAARFPAAREALLFYGEIADFEGDWRELREIALRHGPAMLRDAASRLTAERIEAEPAGFFARVLARRNPPVVRVVETGVCPSCGHPPQVACLRPEGHGTVFLLACSLCRREWTFPRGHCPVCGETSRDNITYFAAEGIPHISTRVCETCGRYLHVVNLEKDPEAIPDVDEVAALAMDVWAAEQGWEKVCPNLIGI
ncbi:MAG: formate dehydrogenase accessory protein FdhE [Acidobacteria bacterium]|nr:formate dehydrogenase accessory protein FdhE [Acidobacteriota bacterium]